MGYGILYVHLSCPHWLCRYLDLAGSIVSGSLWINFFASSAKTAKCTGIFLGGSVFFSACQSNRFDSQHYSSSYYHSRS